MSTRKKDHLEKEGGKSNMYQVVNITRRGHFWEFEAEEPVVGSIEDANLGQEIMRVKGPANVYIKAGKEPDQIKLEGEFGKYDPTIKDEDKIGIIPPGISYLDALAPKPDTINESVAKTIKSEFEKYIQHPKKQETTEGTKKPPQIFHDDKRWYIQGPQRKIVLSRKGSLYGEFLNIMIVSWGASRRKEAVFDMLKTATKNKTWNQDQITVAMKGINKRLFAGGVHRLKIQDNQDGTWSMVYSPK
jgi:hypothetical protein